MERTYWIEHQVRNLINGRGMRPSRAIARVLGLTDPEQIKALAALWCGDEFAVTIGDSRELFVAAYAQVRSCMQGKGALCWCAYSKHATSLAVVTIGGQIKARALVRDSAYNTAYGELSWALKIFLSVVCQYDDRPLFPDCTPQVTQRVRREYETKVGHYGRWFTLWVRGSVWPKWAKNLEVLGDAAAVCGKQPWQWTSFTARGKPAKKKVVETVSEVLFTPYIDR